MDSELLMNILRNPIIMVLAGGVAVFMAFLLLAKRNDLPRIYQVIFGAVLVLCLVYFLAAALM